MKLVAKLTLALVLGMCVVLSVYGQLTVRRERALFEAAMQHDARRLGRAVGKRVAEVWRREGEQKALEAVDDAGDRYDVVSMRWVWYDAPAEERFQPLVPRESLAGLERGEEIVRVDRRVPNDGSLLTYVPIHVPDKRLGALEISESLHEQQQYVHATILHTLVAMFALVGLSGIVAVAAGEWFVGRPIRALRDKARRIGNGQLDDPLTLNRSDEFGRLAEEMNLMCERLSDARTRVQQETSARISALDQLRHADRLTTVGKLASGIAHELGTPLNVVDGRARMIARLAIDDSIKDNARIIAQQTQRMTAIIQQVLDFGRRRASHKNSSDVVSLGRRTLELLRPLAERRDIRLGLVTEREPLLAQIDAGQIQQALTNLLMNAIQASPDSGEVKVTIAEKSPPSLQGVREHEAHVSIAVHDDGHGIAAEHLDHVFEPFFTTKDVGEGTGLGLSVSHGIVAEHGGSIVVDSENGKGATFTIYLPIART